MNPAIVFTFVSILSSASHNVTSTPGHEVHVHSLAMQTDERAGRDCSGSSTVIVYEHASDMPKAGGK